MATRWRFRRTHPAPRRLPAEVLERSRESDSPGPPLVVVSCCLSHLQHDWQSPVWRHFLDDRGRIATVVRYDERGFGLSDWTVDDFSLHTRREDLPAVL